MPENLLGDVIPEYLRYSDLSAVSPIVYDGQGEFSLDVATLEPLISHLNISDIGVNTHAQIDTHIADANIHVDHTAVDITAGDGLSGGGDISATRTIDLDIDSLATTTTMADTDSFAIDGGGTNERITLSDLVTNELDGEYIRRDGDTMSTSGTGIIWDYNHNYNGTGNGSLVTYDFNHTTAGTGTRAVIDVDYDYSGTEAVNAGNNYAGRFNLTSTLSSSTAGFLCGLNAVIAHNGTGNLGQMIAFQFGNTTNSAGTITNYSTVSGNAILAGGTNVTTAKLETGFFANFGGTIGTYTFKEGTGLGATTGDAKCFDARNMPNQTSSWCYYSAQNNAGGKWYCGYRIGVGVTQPNERLEVDGNIRLASDGDQIQFGFVQDANIAWNDTDQTLDVTAPAVKTTGARLVNTRRVTGSVTMDDGATPDHTVYINGSGITYTLTAGVEGRTIRLINVTTNTVTVAPNGAELIDGVNASKTFGKGVIDLTYNATEGWW